MSVYDINLNKIKHKDINLYNAIMKCEIDLQKLPAKIGSAKDGTLITEYEQDGKIYFMNSQYNPKKEAEKFAQQYQDVIDYSFMIFFGLGNGLLAKEIRNVLPEHVGCLFYEPSAEIFLHILQHFDLVSLLENPFNRIIVKGLNDKELDVELSRYINSANYKISIYDALPKYRTLFSQDYFDIEERYRYTIKMVQSNLISGKRFGQDIARNNIYNMRYLLNCNCGEELRGIFPPDMPAIIVAAGPSLERNVHLLKKAKGKALIMAVDTALRYLIECDIYPDLAVSVDPRKPIRLFENEKIQDIPLVLDSALNYKVTELMSRKKVIFASSDNAYYNGLFQLVGKNMYTVKNGGSVATVAYSLAVDWGFKRIVLVGQDLALAPDKVHAGKDDVDLAKLKGNLIAVDGYYGDTVYTSKDYKAYLEWFEMILRSNDEVEVINATEGGASIKGAVQMPLEEVINQYCTQNFDFEKTIKNMKPIFVNEGKKLLYNKWKMSLCNLEKLERRLTEGLRYCNDGIHMLQRGDYTFGKIKDVSNRISRIIVECECVDEIYFIDRLTAAEVEDVLEDIYEVKDDSVKEYCRMLEKLKNYIEPMIPAVKEVKAMFEKVISDVEL